MREEDDDDGEERGPQGEKRPHQDGTKEISNSNHRSQASERSHDTSDEDDEDPRPAKRRKLPPAPTDSALTPPDEHHTSRTSQSPSITVESASVAEYQEWSFQGFLKLTKIGHKTTYNLEFQLLHIPEHLHLYATILSEALGMRSDKKTFAEASAPHGAGAHSKMRPVAVRPRIKRVQWTSEEDATVLKMRDEDSYTWEEIYDVLPHRTPGTIQAHYYEIRAGVGEADISGSQKQKRRRGRPRKQT